MRNGEMIVLVEDVLRQKHVKVRLQSVSYEAYAARKAQWNNRLSDSVQRRRFNRSPQNYLHQLEDQWEQICVR